MDKLSAVAGGMESVPHGDAARVGFRKTRCGIVMLACCQGVVFIGVICIIGAVVELYLHEGGGQLTPDDDASVADGFACQGCMGYCPGGRDCARCSCYMVPLRCAENDPGAPCWDKAYERPLLPVGPDKALCGIHTVEATSGCGL